MDDVSSAGVQVLVWEKDSDPISSHREADRLEVGRSEALDAAVGFLGLVGDQITVFRSASQDDDSRGTNLPC
jgi:hypothetical protein